MSSVINLVFIIILIPVSFTSVFNRLIPTFSIFLIVFYCSFCLSLYINFLKICILILLFFHHTFFGLKSFIHIYIKSIQNVQIR